MKSVSVRTRMPAISMSPAERSGESAMFPRQCRRSFCLVTASNSYVPSVCGTVVKSFSTRSSESMTFESGSVLERSWYMIVPPAMRMSPISSARAASPGADESAR